jgi:UDPglucose--hexose-1-phosphate uridylyltransferase
MLTFHWNLRKYYNILKEKFMRELRRDQIHQRWVVISTENIKEPSDFNIEEEIIRDKDRCPFCPGKENEDLPEIYSVKKENKWLVRVIPDKSPIFIEGKLDRRAAGIYDKMNGVGAHELVIEDPSHIDWTIMDREQIKRVIKVYKKRHLDLRKDIRIRQIVVVKNYGEASSILLHPHSHIVALPVIPKGVEEEIQGAVSYFNYKERCVFCDIVKEEIKVEKRIIYENEGFITFSPFASRFPFEAWIMQKRHLADFGNIDDENIDALAESLKIYMTKIKKVLDDPSFSLILHTAPIWKNRIDGDYNMEYHWHIEVIPKLMKIAGFEWGTGFFTNPTPPELATKFLREA